MLSLQQVVGSSDGSERLLLRAMDGQSIETVAMPRLFLTSVCLSTQVGCPVRCRFCASGIDGLARNLTAAEIIAQVEAVAARPHCPPVRRIVFMGSGEPLLNVEAVLEALDVLRDRFRIGRRHIRVSTVGLPRGLARLAEHRAPPGLALSLHAVRDDLRRELIPFAPLPSVEATLAAALDYGARARVRIAIQYLLLDGINDSVDDARRLRDLVRGEEVKIDLLRHNPVGGTPYRGTAAAAEQAFAATLFEAGIHVTRRRSRGRDAGAACGQLRRHSLSAKPQS